ncbi:MAG: DUF2993 domain-containing protein [Cryobacterium sp.]|nr:DUF2993 domain-containing protein [Cryobacterium sp.]
MARRGKTAPDNESVVAADLDAGKAVPVQVRSAERTSPNAVAPAAKTDADAQKQKPPLGERAVTFRVIWVVALSFVLSWSLLIVGAIVMENLGRDRVALFVADRAQAMLQLDPQHPVAVDIGGAPLILQLVNQHLDSVTVTTEGVTLGELEGDVVLTATGVPFDTTMPFERVFAEVRVDEELVSRIASSVTNATVTSVTLVEPEVLLGTTITIPGLVIFGITITPELVFDVGIGLEPFVADGSIAFTPTSFEVNGNKLSAEAFADAYRNAAQSLMQVGAICVADQLPAVLALESVAVSGTQLVIGLGADGAIFSNETLAIKGTC